MLAINFENMQVTGFAAYLFNLAAMPGGDDEIVEGDWEDEEDEDFDDQMEDLNDLNEIRAADDLDEPDPDPDDDDHLPDDDLQ